MNCAIWDKLDPIFKGEKEYKQDARLNLATGQKYQYYYPRIINEIMKNPQNRRDKLKN